MNPPPVLQLSRHLMARLPPGPDVPLAPLDAVLLAWLALEGPTSRERLAALLWAKSGMDVAANSLRQRLFKLRRRWGSSLVTGQATLALAAGVQHDLQQADDLLGDLTFPGCEELNQWLRAQRDVRAARASQSLVAAAESAEAAREFEAALVVAQQLLRRSPQSEAAHRRVMRLHYLRGDRASALLAFDQCEQMLKDDVGAPPSQETLALLHAVEQQHTGSSLQPASAIPAVVLRPPRLVGRQREQDDIRRSLAALGVVVVLGDAGMGKSRLIDAVAGSGEGPPVWCVAARPGDELVPFSLLARWLRKLLESAGLQPTAQQRQDLARVLPELGTPPTRLSDAERALQLAALEALLHEALAKRAATFVFDDLHYADTRSVQILHSLLGSAAGAGCGWLLAMRPDETATALQALLDQHSGTSRASVVHLQALTPADVEALLSSLGLPGWSGAEQALALHRRTGGNPLYLLETLKAVSVVTLPQPQRAPVAQPGVAPTPPQWPQAENVMRLIQQRLSRLSPLALKITRCAAVAGQDFTSSLAAQVLGLRPLDLADAWAELEAAQVLRQTSFTHDLIGDAARALVPEAIAQPLHAEVAAALEQACGDPARTAEHWTAAGEPRKAVPHLLQAAARASAAGDLVLAYGWRSRAAATLLSAGDPRAAFEAYVGAAQALTESAAYNDPRLLALADQLDGLKTDAREFALACCVRLVVLLGQGQLVEARQLGEQGLAQAEQAGAVDVQVELLWSLTALCWELRDLKAALSFARSALARLPRADVAASQLDLVRVAFKLRHAMGVMLGAAGHFAEAEANMAVVLEQARLERSWGNCASIATTLAASCLERGDLKQAQVWAQEILGDNFHRVVLPRIRQLALAQAAHTLAAAGNLGRALACAQEVLALSDQHGEAAGVYALRKAHLLFVDLGRRDLALKGLRACQQRPDLTVLERLGLQVALAHLGEPVEAEPLLDTIAANEDFSVRCRLLCQLAPACEPGRVLPLLSAMATSALDLGATGVWMGLQTQRMAVLRRQGRQAEAAEMALPLWQHLDQGLAGVDLFPTAAAQVCLSLAPVQPALADTIRLRVSAWVHQAAASLPAAWRENYLARAPALQLLLQAPAEPLPLAR